MLDVVRARRATRYWQTSSGLLHLEGCFSSNEIRLLATAAVAGLVIAYLPDSLVQPHLDSGRLVQVLKGTLEIKGRLALVYAEREFLPPQVRAFVEAVVSWLPRLKDALGPSLPAPRTK